MEERFFPRLLPVLIALLAVLPACSTITVEQPPVADSTLVEVLIGMHLAEARAEIKGDVPAGLRDSILAHHHLTKRRFDAAMDYYVAHPEAYTALYGRVLDSLQAQRRR